MRDVNRTHRARVLSAAFAAPLLVLTGAVACGDEAEEPTVEEITDVNYFGDTDEFVGDTVTLEAEVTEVLSPQSFELGGQDWGDESLLVTSAEPVDVQQGNMVEVTGTVGEAFIYADYVTEYDLVDPAVYTVFENEKFLVATNVDTDPQQ